ncbi:MAG: hypothetical protein ACK59Y_06550 [Betaproteobacteria bacterium]|jgi:hypothetical protein
MKISRDQARLLAQTVDLEIPEADLDNVTLRVSALLAAMAEMEQVLGEEMDGVEPLPPVFPREDFE